MSKEMMINFGLTLVAVVAGTYVYNKFLNK
jgi:hypothetical protein